MFNNDDVYDRKIFLNPKGKIDQRVQQWVFLPVWEADETQKQEQQSLLTKKLGHFRVGERPWLWVLVNTKIRTGRENYMWPYGAKQKN